MAGNVQVWIIILKTRMTQTCTAGNAHFSFVPVQSCTAQSCKYYSTDNLNKWYFG